MADSSPSTQSHSSGSSQTDRTNQATLNEFSSLELATALAKKLAIQPNDWHRLNTNRKIRAQEQMATALVYLLNEQSEEAIARLKQAIGWLDRSISAPPCPTHKR